MLKSKITVHDIPELTKDFLPMTVSLDSFLCWLALVRMIVQDVLAGHYPNAHVALNISVEPRFGASQDVSLVFSWSVRWPDHGGIIRLAQGSIAFEMLLAMMQPEGINTARKLQTGEIQMDNKPITRSLIGQGKKPWPYDITDEFMMVASYVYNQAWNTMASIEQNNAQIHRPKAQA